MPGEEVSYTVLYVYPVPLTCVVLHLHWASGVKGEVDGAVGCATSVPFPK